MQKPGDWSFGRNVVNGHYDFPWRVAPPIHALSLLLLSAACTSGALTYTHIYLLSHCSYLVLTAITFTGQLIFGSDLMRSTAYDAHIYQETEHLHPQLPWELNIGDGHFATCARFFTPAQKTGGRALTSREIMWNEWLQLVRSRVEHINTVIKNHRMFKGEPYRGWVRNLKIFVRISLHGAAAELRHRAQRDGDRYPGFGPWAH